MVTTADSRITVHWTEYLPLYVGGFIATFSCIVSVSQAVALPSFISVAGAAALVGFGASFWMRTHGVSPNVGLLLFVGLLAAGLVSWELGVTEVIRRQVLVPVPLMGDAGVAVLLTMMMVAGAFGAIRNEVVGAILVPGLAAQGVMGGAILAGEVVLSFLIFILAGVYVLASVQYLNWRGRGGLPRRPHPRVWASTNAVLAVQVFLATVALAALFSIGFGMSLGRLLGLLEPRVTQIVRELDPERRTWAWHEFAPSFELGRGPVALNDEPVMLVRSERGSYWRARVYQGYDGREWSGASATSERRWPVSAGRVTVEATDFPGPVIAVDEEYRLMLPSPHIYVGGRPAVVEFPDAGQVRTVYASEGGYSLRVEPMSARYRVTAEVPRGVPPPIGYQQSDLAALHPYLLLPRDLDQRIEDLARRVTRGETAVDRQAAAIADYLRSTYTYRLDPEAMPPNEEAVSYFLFEQREGFCEIFASTMAVMLRTLLIPARVAVGFGTGEWDPRAQAYLVRANMAHAWVEVYLPGFGWTVYDPTPPDFVFPTSALPEEEVPQAPWWAFLSRMSVPLMLMALGFVMLAVGMWPAWRMRRTAVPRVWSQAQRAIFEAYRQTLDWLAGTGLRRRRWETPREFAARCRRQMEGNGLAPVLPPLDDLTSVFVQARYARDGVAGAVGRAQQARDAVRTTLRRERRAVRRLRRLLGRDGRD